MITLNEAKTVIAAAEKKAAEIGQPMNIAIADERESDRSQQQGRATTSGDWSSTWTAGVVRGSRPVAVAAAQVPLAEARIFIEINSTVLSGSGGSSGSRADEDLRLAPGLQPRREQVVAGG